MAKHNSLHHDKTLSSHRTEASYARSEKRYTCNSKSARIASRRYNKACRAAAKLQLSRYQKPRAAAEATEEPVDPNWADQLAEEIREEWWDDCEFEENAV